MRSTRYLINFKFIMFTKTTFHRMSSFSVNYFNEGTLEVSIVKTIKNRKMKNHDL